MAVGVEGGIVWAEGFGWAHLANRVPVTPETRFRIGTASQVLTSAAVGLLLEKGALGFDDEIQMHVPAFPKKQWPVTLRQLMGHVAGIRNDEEGEEPVSVSDDDPQSVRCQGPGDGLERFADGALQFEPETQFRSSSYGWILVSAAVEEAADEPFSTFMRKKIFEPLGMSDTMADSPREPGPDRMPFYFPRFSADPKYGPDEGRDVDYSCFSGSAAFLSTPSDLVRFGMAINSGKLLRPATVQLLQAPQRLTSGQDTGYGLGWDLETVELIGEQTRLAGHDGELMGGMVASLITFPRHGIVVSVTTNIAFADTYSVAVKIAQAFAEQEKSPAAR